MLSVMNGLNPVTQKRAGKAKRIFFEGDIVHIDNYDEGWDSVVEFNGGAFAVDVEGRDYDYTAIGWTEYQSIISATSTINTPS